MIRPQSSKLLPNNCQMVVLSQHDLEVKRKHESEGWIASGISSGCLRASPTEHMAETAYGTSPSHLDEKKLLGRTCFPPIIHVSSH